MTILTKLIKRKINPTFWHKDNNKLKAMKKFHPYSSGSRNSAQVRGDGNKHEVYLATFSGHFFLTYFCRADLTMTPCPLLYPAFATSLPKRTFELEAYKINFPHKGLMSG